MQIHKGGKTMKHIDKPSKELQEVNDKIYDLVRRCNKPDDYDQQLDELLKRQEELLEKEGT
jgi:hypothetical protein